MKTRFPFVALMSLAAALTSAPASAQERSYPAVFALQSGAPEVGAHLLVTPGTSALDAKLDLWTTGKPSSAAVRVYDLDMTKRMHVIAIGDDLTTFLHVHPQFAPDGHFRIALAVPRQGLYHIYADFIPHGKGRQVFRFDVPFGDASAMHRGPVVPAKAVHAGPYLVTLSGLDVRAGGTTMLKVSVTKDGAPAKDLHAYLGASAHAVFIDVRHLTYAHVHPVVMGEMGSMHPPGMDVGGSEMSVKPGSPVAPDMMLHVSVRDPGAYRLWLQFMGGSDLYVAPFALQAR